MDAERSYTVAVRGVDALVEWLFNSGDDGVKIVEAKMIGDDLMLRVVAGVGFPRGKTETLTLYHDVQGRKGKAVPFTLTVQNGATGGWIQT